MNAPFQNAALQSPSRQPANAGDTDAASVAGNLEVAIIRNAPPPLRWRWPFDQMQAGDAFDAPVAARSSLSCLCSTRKRNKGEVYTIRKIDDQTIRVWRLA